MATMYKKVFFGKNIVDHKDAQLSIASSAVLYGLSVYTVFPVSQNEKGELIAFRLADHFKRLLQSAHILAIDTFADQWTYESFEKATKRLIRANAIKRDVYVRATVHVTSEIAGTRSRGLVSTLSMFVYDAEPILRATGARLKTSHWRRIPDFAIPSRAKVNGAYVNSVLAKQDALDSGYDDALFLDSLGHVCELSAANIFMVRHGKLITPDTTTDLLEGINRRTVIELAKKELGIEVEERSIDITELYIADEVFASGTSANIAPVLEIDKRAIGNGSIGSLTELIQSRHRNLIHGNDAAFTSYYTIL
ncbi:MAG TPA: aminotransferase class IV [Candidatus Saccharibacteria bacterium]|jgi:branched-chain amino acid aminotransferase|nr:aminotransferase class IV [Candidatus Saccharibacteria bacterium]HMT56173.1 aminotransferase class IV [Candidatus Saccharibacteria bacterium]